MTEIFVTILVALGSIALDKIVDIIIKKKTDAEKEEKVKEENVIKIKKDLYNGIKKYARSLPDIAPRDLLNRLEGYGKYPYMSAEETKKFILDKYNKAKLSGISDAEISLLKILCEQINDNIIRFENACKIYEEICINSSDDLDKYVNENIVDLFIELDAISSAAYKYGTKGYYDRSYFDNTKDNEFVEIYNKLLGAINDELDELDKLDKQ